MRQHIDTNIFACFVSYPSLVADVSEQTKDEAIKKGDMFRSYIWGEAGLDRFLKKIRYSDYGQDLKRILFQFTFCPVIMNECISEILRTIAHGKRPLGFQ